MSQYDASSIPMYNAFTHKPDFTAYEYEEPRTSLVEINGSNAPGAQISAKLDFSGADHANEDQLNQVLWEQTMKGKKYPTSKNK